MEGDAWMFYQNKGLTLVIVRKLEKWTSKVFADLNMASDLCQLMSTYEKLNVGTVSYSQWHCKDEKCALSSTNDD